MFASTGAKSVNYNCVVYADVLAAEMTFRNSIIMLFMDGGIFWPNVQIGLGLGIDRVIRWTLRRRPTTFGRKCQPSWSLS